MLGITVSDEEILEAVMNITVVASATILRIDVPGREVPLPVPSNNPPKPAKPLADVDVLPRQENSDDSSRRSDHGEERKDSHLPVTGSSIRVKSKLLDELLDLVGEIMINNIRINQIATDLKHRELMQTLQNNSRLMGEMQDIVLRTRMVPVDFIFKRFPRIVRDLSRSTGKEVDFVMQGNDIEIDRSLLDEIGDALVHLIRNSLDHGLEPPEERAAKGKSPRGSIVLSATQEQSNIIITVEDDGRGMDPQVIIAKAISKGLINAEEAGRLDDRSKLQFVPLPGFSTAA